MKQKSLAKLQKEVDDFNLAYPVGSEVDVKLDSGKLIHTKVTNEATILGGHSAVGWFNDISGCYSLDRVTGHE